MILYKNNHKNSSDTVIIVRERVLRICARWHKHNYVSVHDAQFMTTIVGVYVVLCLFSFC